MPPIQVCTTELSRLGISRDAKVDVQRYDLLSFAAYLHEAPKQIHG
jgi:hypothetical protein